MVLAEVLRELGWAVEIAPDAAVALALVESDPGIELVLSDHRMPGMTGVELARELWQRHPAVRAVLLTAFGDELSAPAPSTRTRSPCCRSRSTSSISSASSTKPAPDRSGDAAVRGDGDAFDGDGDGAAVERRAVRRRAVGRGLAGAEAGAVRPAEPAATVAAERAGRAGRAGADRLGAHPLHHLVGADERLAGKIRRSSPLLGEAGVRVGPRPNAQSWPDKVICDGGGGWQ